LPPNRRILHTKRDSDKERIMQTSPTQHGQAEDAGTADPTSQAELQAMDEVAAQLDDKTRQLGEAYRRFADTGRDVVRHSPATSVLVALVAGYGLSKLLSGRRH
jgi:hypothetical protein